MSGILGGGRSGTQPMPKQPDPIRIPQPDDPDVMAARRRKIQETTIGREGSKSTDLTNPYTRTTLG